MAQRDSYVLLGYIDELIDDSNKSLVDFTTNKIGGKANWINAKDEEPSCIICSRPMLLVLQLYAPIKDCLNHRTLFIFACITPECWNKPHSWSCVRSEMSSQLKEKKSESKRSTVPAFDCPDDWNLNDGNGNMEASSESNVISNISNDNLLDTNFNSYGDVEISNLTQNLNIYDDSMENENMAGAIALQENMSVCEEAYAIIEEPEDDVISVETPEKCSTDLSSIFQDAARVSLKENVVFDSYFIASDLEYLQDSSFSKREQELMIRLSNTIKNEISSPTNSNREEEEEYEKISTKDYLFHKFSKRIRNNPAQILRYNREDGLQPLWLQAPENYPKKCQYCSSNLIFEVQVMPQLLNVLKVHGIKSPLLEFGTIIILTCAKSCWSDKLPSREEIVIVQSEP